MSDNNISSEYFFSYTDVDGKTTTVSRKTTDCVLWSTVILDVAKMLDANGFVGVVKAIGVKDYLNHITDPDNAPYIPLEDTEQY